MFKFLFYTIVWFVLMGILGACSNEEGYDSRTEYHMGKQNFDYVESNMASLMSFWDLSLRMNTYLAGLEEDEDRSRELFPDYTLCRMDEQEWIGLKGQDTIFRIIKDDLDLTTETAQWKVIGYRAPYEERITILCSNLRSWKFSVSTVIDQEWISEANLKIDYNGAGIPYNFSDGDWMVSGAGRCIVEEENLLNFEVTESLIRFAGSKYLFDKGVLYLRLKNALSQKEEIAKAEMKALSENKRSLQITYKGEVYSY